MLYLSHKAVHADFTPADRHAGQYRDVDVPLPANMADTPENYAGKPRWVKDQRSSWHGVDFPYHSTLDVAAYKKQYDRTISAVDDSIGRIRRWLAANGLARNTIVMLMGDNGFLFGEHGLIDKRNAYEESMRVPLIASGPGFVRGAVVEEVVANLDIAPTLLDYAGISAPRHFQGRSFRKLADGSAKPGEWSSEFAYEYFWEYNFPHTPTTFAIRTDRYKLIQYHGVWDTEELYDMRSDPAEMHNLIDEPDMLATIIKLRARLYELSANPRGEHVVPFTQKRSQGAVFRHVSDQAAGRFPQTLAARR